MSDERESDSPNRHWGNRIIVVLFTVILAPLGLTLLYRYYDPHGANPYFPGCFFKEWTTLNCPGCGATRCLYSLLHLDIAQALAYNPLFVVVLPYLVYSGADILYTLWTDKPSRGYRMPGWAGKYILIVVLSYWVLRNIDIYPLSLLAPHELALPG